MRFPKDYRVRILGLCIILLTIGYTVNFFPNNILKRSPSSSRTCQAKRHIVFLKIQKTASSTVLNVLHRYGDRNGLLFALPFGGHFSYPNFFHSRMVKGFNSSMRQKYDLICYHMRFNLPEVRKVMPSDSFYFTILRDPATLAESSFSYNHYFVSAFKKASNFSAFISNPSHYYKQGENNHQYALNLLWFNLGFNPEAPFTEDLATTGVQAVEGSFDLVLLAEHFDESMILLKEELCWELDDVVTFKVNMREASIPLEQREVEKLRAWNALDWYLYSHFNRTFWEKVEYFGRAKMDNEVRKLRERRQELAKLCLESLEPVQPQYIKEKAFRPYQSGQHKILGWDLKTNIPLQDHLLCVKMVTPELPYLDLLNARQFLVGGQNKKKIQ